MSGYSCGILTVSDKGSRGEREDTSGPNLNRLLTENGFTVVAYEIVADQPEDISRIFIDWADNRAIDLIISTGGTGVSPSDLTPEATRPILDREIPGIGEAMRQASLLKTPNAILSRGIAGIRKQSLIINLPGSKKAAQENIEAILGALDHAIYKIKGGSKDCGA
ncbi:MAG: MogA/MoaB family molybdenum cofactor biosynthesis protein [Desulfobulbaceae bacterium]|nr:MogA/MoaB family molybdenum cofactor biosynthesis protein [Desulfobulbaceae bacterium]HIJ79087.1 MogA/MoaB family molybdenum cofactor biosynthesis protein [Deltaproteobacteria bacterium]